ncbi:hypothetical protein PIB30_110162 [Stylosanthes scabra]|uniref:Uncharacterized protein n=1 Tax=Stylosanthes scabra TaxID=79078 RepID=A0ABU6S0L3_9FABA|nr:hypothetical protein [Stylosanthes scabra]
MPCVHGVAAIAKLGLKPVEEFVSPFLTTNAIRATYDICINPMTSEEFWYPTDAPRPTAPRIVRPPGRPRKKRTEAARPPPPAAHGDKPKKKRPKMKKADQNLDENAGTSAGTKPEPSLDDILDKARRQKKKMPKKPNVPQDPRDEIPVSQSAPPVMQEDGHGNAAHTKARPTFTIPVPPPMPKALQKLRPKQKIFRPPTPFQDIQFNIHPAQPRYPPTQPPQNQSTTIHPGPVPNQPPPNRPSSSNLNAISPETIVATLGSTAKRLYQFMPTPNFRPPKQN